LMILMNKKKKNKTHSEFLGISIFLFFHKSKFFFKC
jgi:hypothetical protein